MPVHADQKSAAVPSFTCENLQVTLVGAAGANVILDGIDLTVARGEFVSVLGPSGSGKTTLLRVLGGLQEKSGGTVRSADAPVEGPPADVVTVFQDYSHSLLPWRSVRRNVALGIESKLTKPECAERVAEALTMVGLQESADEYPWRLSGGMQQRVQIARALAMRPSVLLMDEPFGALDAMTKASLQDQLQRVQELTGTTVVFVTHDIEEAVYLSHRVLVLEGRPAHVGLDLAIGLPSPRDQITTKESPEYLALRHRVYEAMGHGKRHA
ncbi:ABC transporter ATP-binding protein [Streptomyces sp. MP131-18]|uniref:ABC transporter ATP-binding protein n=1 Tax=Streptomyces sp. MP131-18 TaxID=1857892 RepID=UPI00097C3ECD|nr:ABC transporter ATP-binding protein [Streptomyces sp. MP131-18]ONK14333.1 Bicarbonate transport ATP-binding protein CmpD [Streptomyces sp. MP131-18]